MATVTLRPNGSTVASGGNWVTVGGGTLHGNMADNNDATAARSQTNQMKTLTVQFDTFAFPAGTAINSVTPRYRFAHTTAPTQTHHKLYASIVGETFAPDVATDEIQGSVTFTTYAGITRTSRPAGGAWTQADIDALEIIMTTSRQNGIEFINTDFAELYLDVVYTPNAPPNTPTVTGPTGTVLTASPHTATWNYSDPEGNAQDRYQVKVFTAAQYGIGGFNPETSPNTWASGEVASAVTSVSLTGLTLTSGTTYKVYVKVRDSGSLTYSAWGAGPTFTYNAPPAAVLTAPTGVQTTSRPTIAWGYSDPEGNLQERYRAKVFTAAQYDAVGFDPDTAASIWDSGEVLSAAASVVIGADLIDATTYRAYVKVGDVGSSGRYSPWAFIGFSVTIAAPPTPTLTASADSALSRMRLDATVGAYTLADQKVSIQRSIDNGASWVGVRGAFEVVVASEGTLTVYDYEMPRGEAVLYRARVVADPTGSRVASPWTESVGAQSLRLSGVSGSYASLPDSPEISLAGATVLRLPGTSGNYASTPDTPASSVIDDIDVRMKVAPDSWAVGNRFISKHSGNPGQRSYQLRSSVGGDGHLQFVVFADGSTSVTFGSTIPVPFAAGEVGWIRATLDVDNGASGKTATFYTSTDGSSWTPLGSAVTQAGTMSIFDSTDSVTLGSQESGSTFPMTIYYAEVRRGISGPVVAKFDPSTIFPTVDQLPTTLVSSTGETWTLNGTKWNWRRDNEVRSLRLSGAAGVYASTPDSAALSLQGTASALRVTDHTSTRVECPDRAAFDFIGDIDVRAKVTPDNWALGRAQQVVTSDAGDPNRRFRFYISSTGALVLEWFPLGTVASLLNASSGATGLSPGQTKWIRVTLDVDNGAAGRDVKFYTSDDGAAWSQLGATVTQAGTTTLANTTGPLELGSRFNGFGGDHFVGLIHYAEVRDGIGGTVVADPRFDTTEWTIGDQAGTARSDGGNTWTLYGNAEIVAQAERRSLRLTGAVGVYASTPDSAALSITGDIDIRVKVALDDWTPGTDITFVGKYATTGNQRSYKIGLSSGNQLILTISTDGANNASGASGIVTGIPDGSTKWVRATRAQASGDVNFYLSDDGVTWTPHGATTAIFIGTAIFDSTAVLEVGSISQGTLQTLAGNVFYAEVRNGIGGTVVANPDFTSRPWDVGETGGATGADAAGNTWTLNGAAVIQRAFASDLDVRIKVALDDWTPSGFQALIAKWDGGASWRVLIDPSAIAFASSPNGVVEDYANSTALGLTDGGIYWVRVTWVASTGVVSFYTSSDGITWTAKGTSSNPHGHINDSSGQVRIGTASGQNLAGNVLYAEVRDGIDGTVVANPSFENQPWDVGETGGATGVDGAGNTWTLNGAAAIQRAFASDLDIRVKVAMDDATPATIQALVSKWEDALSNHSYLFRVETSGQLRLYVSPVGATSVGVVSSAPGLINGAVVWLRVTRVHSSGLVSFYKSNDGVTWTALGTATLLANTPIHDGSALLAIGARNAGTTEWLAGNVHYAELRNAIDGPVVASFDSDEPWLNGDTLVTRDGWTLNGQAAIVGGQQVAPTGWWLKDPAAPALNMKLEVQPGFGYRQKEPQTVYEPLGRDVSVVVTDGVKGIEGSMEVWSKDKARYAKLKALVGTGRVLLLENVLGEAWYVKLSTATQWSMMRAQPASGETSPLRHLHSVSLPFVEVGAPPGNVVAPGTPTP